MDGCALYSALSLLLMQLLAAYNFALKKTKKSITVSLSQLEGAAIMNNTFCLFVFLFMIFLQLPLHESLILFPRSLCLCVTSLDKH